MFGDNFSVVDLTVMPTGKLQRCSHIINYNRTREDQAKRVIKFVQMHGNDNPANIVTKSHLSNTWFPLMKPLIFWSDMDFIKERVVPREVKTCRQYRLYLKLRALHISPSRFILGIF